MEVGVKRLTSKSEGEYRAWARHNYQRHTRIDPFWHQVIRNECDRMNCEQPLKVRRVMALSPDIVKMFEVECGCAIAFLKPEPIDEVGGYVFKPVWLKCSMHKDMNPQDMVIQAIVEE